MEQYLCEIRLFGGLFAPKGWAFCEGQLLSTEQFPGLFSILKTTYGGDGVSTFALPDFRGRIPMHSGQGVGLSSRTLGEKLGEASYTLTTEQMATHNHAVAPTDFNPRGIDEKDNNPNPEGRFPSKVPNGGVPIYIQKTDTNMALQQVELAVGQSGNNQPVDNVQPTIALRYIIALVGHYPMRS